MFVSSLSLYCLCECLCVRDAGRTLTGKSCILISQCYVLDLLKGGTWWGGTTPYVGQYTMLSYTWVVLKAILVLFLPDGYLFSTRFLYYFPREVCIFLKKVSAFVVQDGTRLQEIFCILFHRVGAIYV